MRAYAYMRCSGLGQREGDTWERQGERIRRAAEAMKLEIVGEYRDEGVTGKRDPMKRPGFSTMFADMKANGVEAFIFEDVQRLARASIITEHVVAMIMARPELQIFTADTMENIAESVRESPMGRVFFKFRGLMAEYMKDELVSRMKVARERIRSSKGKCEGRKAFGERDGERPILEALIRMAAKCRWGSKPNFAEVARAANQQGLPTRTGKPWTAATVGKILRRHGVR